jgi:hypothetical protein
MQYRQPMHFVSSYTTGPKAVFCMAPTGHTDAQVGSAQCMHERRAYLSRVVWIATNLCAEIFSSAAILSSYGCPQRPAHAFSHSRQPTHIVLS